MVSGGEGWLERRRQLTFGRSALSQTGTVKMNYAVSDDYRPNKHKGYRVCAPDCYGGFMDKGERD